GIQPQHHPPAAFQRVFRLLKERHQSHPNSFLLGDFNFVDQPIDRPAGLNSNDKKILKFWNALTTDLQLTDPYRCLYPKRKIYSFHQKGTTGNSRIDRVYIPHSNLKHKYQYITTPFQDHKLQHFTYATTILQGRGTWKLNGLNGPVVSTTDYRLIHPNGAFS
ncbi:MAG: hypothetical protein VX772_04195, partial [Bacteroidota bacterium]|nr:hypothetical protein [Bacteroidota bacterium]